MPAAGGQPRLLTDEPGDSMIPSWSFDGKSIYFIRRQGAQSGLWKKAESGGTTTLVVNDARWDALESPDGSALYFVPGATGMWELRQGSGTASPIPELKDASPSRHFAVSTRGIYFVEAKANPAVVRFFDFRTRRVTDVLTIGKPLALQTPSLSVSPDGRWLMYSEIDDRGSDLMMLK
jgi:Tol biopolymer transport system component